MTRVWFGMDGALTAWGILRGHPTLSQLRASEELCGVLELRVLLRSSTF